MKLFDKVKNLFTEEYEEEIKPIKTEVKHVDVTPKTRMEREFNEEKFEDDILEEERDLIEDKKEEKFVFFSDDDFKDLDKPRREEKREYKEPVVSERPLYNGATIKTEVEEKKPFKPSLIISPVYGVLDKNYTKDEVVSKKVTPTRIYGSKPLSVDDIRNKAYGTIEDEIKDSLLGFEIEKEAEPIENDIDIFEELEKYDELDKLEDSINKTKETDIDDIFDELDNKKDEILDELDNKKEEILDELITKKDDIIDNEDIEELDFDEETLELSKQLESQKRKLDEIEDFIDDNEDDIDLKNEDDLNESELFDLIDSMYDKKDDE